MLHIPLDVKVLVLITWNRYICVKKKSHHHHPLGESREPLCPMKLTGTQRPFRY